METILESLLKRSLAKTHRLAWFADSDIKVEVNVYYSYWEEHLMKLCFFALDALLRVQL